MTLLEVTDCGGTDGRQRIYRGSSYLIDCVTRVRIQIIVDEEMVETVVDAILATAYPGEIGNGNISIYPVAETISIAYGAKEHRHRDHATVARDNQEGLKRLLAQMGCASFQLNPDDTRSFQTHL